MTEAEKWRDKARQWYRQSETSSDQYVISTLKNLAHEADKLADEIERGEVLPYGR